MQERRLRGQIVSPKDEVGRYCGSGTINGGGAHPTDAAATPARVGGAELGAGPGVGDNEDKG